MPYELKASDIYDFASFIGHETRDKGDEIEFKYCPYCDGGDHKDKYTFSVNRNKGAFKCLRSSCGKQGHFVELCRDFDYELDFGKQKVYKQLKQPEQKVVPKPEAVKYLESRGISEETAKKYEITVHKENPAVMVFPFYNEFGKLVFIKFRNMKFKKGCKGDKEWCEKDTQPILFGMKQCNLENDTLIITEGQLDSLSVAECGYENAVSVPTGANGFTWLGPCRQWIEDNFKTVIVFGDWENGKMSLLDTLMARLEKPVIKAVKEKFYLGEKDANDILRNYGKQAVIDAIENADRPEVSRVKDLSDVRQVDMTQIRHIRTGLRDLDKVIGGLAYGEVTLLSGKRGEGKSTFMSQMICYAIDQGETVFVYSGELQDYMFKWWMDLQLAGAENIVTLTDENGEPEYTINDEIRKKISNWYRGKAYIYDNEADYDREFKGNPIIETIKNVIRQYGVTVLFIDNLMTAMSHVTSQNDLYLMQSNFVGELKKIAQKYDVAIVLVAHPRKVDKDIGNDDISGSSDITNKVDNVIVYHRTDDVVFPSKIEVIKNRFSGKMAYGDKAIKAMYSQKSKRIYGSNDSNYHFGWEENANELNIDQLELPF